MLRKFIAMLVCAALTLSCFAALAEPLLNDDPFADIPQAEVETNSEDAPVIESADYYGTSSDESITDYRTLQFGDRDDVDGAAYIVVLQNRLTALGFLKSAPDGIYGNDTRTAIEQFQRLNGLEETGVADAATQQKLYSDIGSLTLPSAENPIAYGSEAERVQSRLAEWGFLTGRVDGILGEGSATAIMRFKRYVKKYDPPIPTATPEPTPAPTPEPVVPDDELPDVDDVPVPTLEPAPTPYEPDSEIDDLVRAYVNGNVSFQVYRSSVQDGDRSDEVGRVQARLKQLGYLFPDPDGVFGSSTQLALKYFQKKNGLLETGVADEYTQRTMFSETAVRAEEYVSPYKVYVDISDQKVYVFAWDGSSYSEKVKTMICSTGKNDTPTPTGTYQAYGQLAGEWYYFTKFNCYAKWAYGIVGGILFHSVTYNANKKPTGSESNLGHKASHGCVRLKVDDAKWIYDHCPYGTTVVIQD